MIGPFRRNRRPKPPELPAPAPARQCSRPRRTPRDDPVRSGARRRNLPSGHRDGTGRLLITGAVMAFAFVAVGARLVDLGAFTPVDMVRAPSYAETAAPKQTERATIVDRNGVIVATNLTASSLAARPNRLLDPVDAAKRLSRVFPELSLAELTAKLTSDAPFVYIHRRLTPKMERAVLELGIPGLEFERAETRIYPHGNLMAHVLGFTDIDGNGLAGIEKGMNERLDESDEPLRLSLDVRFQHAAHAELSAAIEEFDAIGGAAIVTDVETGEILAMVSMPDFDPNRPGDFPAETRFNRVTLGTYELGSTFKIFNTAMALDSGLMDMTDGYDATDPIRISRFTIRDFHGEERYLTIPEIFIHSSNIGSAKMAVDVGPPAQRAFMERLGMLDALDLEIPEIGSPQYPRNWQTISAMTISYGHGLSVTPLHLAAGVAAMVNGGEAVKPTLLARERAARGPRVISERVSDDIRHLMRLNTVEGSGKRAAVPGYMVGGKTGTAGKAERQRLSQAGPDFLLRRVLPDERPALRGLRRSGRTGGHRGDLRLRHGRLGRGPRRGPDHQAHRRHRRDRAHRRGRAGNSPRVRHRIAGRPQETGLVEAVTEWR
jgi:cell division protein FtsI (penicillin-binding protein 3)